MANWFDDVTKTLADEKLSRRQVVWKIAGTVAGVALVAWFPETSLAKNHLCQNPGNACIGKEFPNCGNNPNCFCFQRLDHGNGKGVCGCNAYSDCSHYKLCTKQSDCTKGYSCITNWGCGCYPTGTCIPNCSKTCHGPEHSAKNWLSKS